MTAGNRFLRAVILTCLLWPDGAAPASDPKPVSNSAHVELQQVSQWDGDAIAATAAVTNHGPTPARDVSVVMKCPAHVRSAEADPVPDSQAAEWAWKLGDLKPGESRKVRLRLFLDPASPNEVKLSFRVAARSEIASEQSVAIPPRETLRVVAQVPDEVHVGRECPLVFQLSNVKQKPLPNVALQLTLPDGLTHPSGTELENALGTIEPGQTRTVTLKVTPTRPGELRGALLATYPGGQAVSQPLVVKVQQGRLSIVVQAPPRCDRRAAVAVELTVDNAAGVAAPGCSVTAELPGGVAFVSADDGGVYAEATHTVTWPLGDLPPGQKKTLRLKAVACDAGDQRVTATVRPTRGEGASAAASTTVLPDRGGERGPR